MKIQCDVCDKGKATVFCPADEAALCDGCDSSIHHANKLAGKHTRFSLIHSSKEVPLCDICQERRAFLFCKEDRAILCRECDLPIHKANEHTQKHNRFLLTGVKLNAFSSSSLYPTSSSSNGAESNNIDTDVIRSSQLSIKRPITICNEVFGSPSSGKSTIPAEYRGTEGNQIGDTVPFSTSSISEYLIETLPGWRVEDFLEPVFAANGFFKTNDQSLPFLDRVGLEKNMTLFSSEDLASWVSEVSHHLPQLPLVPRTDFLIGFKESERAKDMNMSNQKWSDHGITVPQISPLKKSRHFR